MREYQLLMPVLSPELVPPEARTGQELARWVEQGLAASRIATFDPDISALIILSRSPQSGGA